MTIQQAIEAIFSPSGDFAGIFICLPFYDILLYLDLMYVCILTKKNLNSCEKTDL